MPLPPSVLRQFNKAPVNPSEAELHGPYNKLLTIPFPSDSRYTVIPQFCPSSRESPNRTVFVLELKLPSGLRFVSKREIADLQINRQHLRDVTGVWRLSSPDSPRRAQWGLGSFYGKQGNRPVNPPRIAPDPQMVIDVAPVVLWDSDLLVEEGLQRFMAVVNDIKESCHTSECNAAAVTEDSPFEEAAPRRPPAHN
ncbi:hypothetical protein K488DRAFT_83414 [Vararia minispora EC-137]|uniref:Uncharacterized protein n=1 Tax=Vararia minispora EC-137 TaxID=1314806 RepID=A0ACB8QTU0_9AGAM|nr:hypothetical protein K488DRAFT_83414 [Vararia minispora EC-137]